MVIGRVSTVPVDSAGVEGVKEARFTLVEPLRMEGFAQPEERVVEVMAKLVEERAEKGAIGDHLPPLGSEHPQRDHVAAATAGRRVEPLELSAVQRRAA